MKKLLALLCFGLALGVDAQQKYLWVPAVTEYLLNYEHTPTSDPLAPPVIDNLPLADPDGALELRWQGHDDSFFVVEMQSQTAAQATASHTLSKQSVSMQQTASTEWKRVYEGSANTAQVTDIPNGNVQVRAKACISDACGEYGMSNIGSIAKRLHANDDSVTVGLHQTATFYPLSNDFEPDALPIWIESIQAAPEYGEASINPDNKSLVYQNTAGQCDGSVQSFNDGIDYVMYSQAGEVAEPASISIKVLCPNYFEYEWVDTQLTALGYDNQYDVFIGEDAIYLRGRPSKMVSIGKIQIPRYLQGDIIRLQKIDAAWVQSKISGETFSLVKDNLYQDEAILLVDQNDDGQLDILYTSNAAQGVSAVAWGSQRLTVGQAPELYWQLADGVSCIAPQYQPALSGDGVVTLPAYYELGYHWFNWTCSLDTTGAVVYQIDTELEINRMPAPTNFSVLEE